MGILEQPFAMQAPPPRDLDAEDAVCSTAFEGKLPQNLSHLDFWSALNASIYISCQLQIGKGIKPSVEFILKAMSRQGFAGAELERAVLDIITKVPYAVDLEEKAWRIRTLAKRRRALRIVEQLDAVIRVPDTKSDELERLAKQLGEVLSGEDT